MARDAGALLSERFGTPARGLSRKSTRTDMVSDADRDAEAVIEAILEAERPDDGLLAEEGAHSAADSGRRWVVDPLDGTTNFLYGIPTWAVSIALEEDDAAVLGVVHDPTRGETFTAVRGAGAELDGEPIAVSAADRLDSALIATGFGYDAERRAFQADVLRGVLPHVRDIRRPGAASLDLCSVACGRVDGYWERGLAAWDWAAGALIASEAGATIELLGGDPAGLLAASPEIAGGLSALVA
jgi:myo-inositol-1(or 4)-monophosphatase